MGRVGVRWGIIQQRPSDRLYNSLEVLNHIIIPKANDAITTARQLAATQCIGISPFAMLPAVKLNSQLACRTGEIDHALADRMLAAKFPLGTFLPQCGPKTPLDIGGVSTKPTRNQRP